MREKGEYQNRKENALRFRRNNLRKARKKLHPSRKTCLKKKKKT